MTRLSRGGKQLSCLTKKYHSGGGFQPVSNDKVIYGLIGMNATVSFAWYQSQSDYRLRDFMNKHFLLSYYGVWNDLRVHTLVSSVFSHQSIGHLAGNMLTLYFFGSGALAMLGVRQFLGLYFGSGVFSSLCTVSWPDLIPPSWPASWQRSRYAPALGASGAGVCVCIQCVEPALSLCIYVCILACMYVYLSICVYSSVETDTQIYGR
jgi:membrane associated rhomboid family serine protease